MGGSNHDHHRHKYDRTPARNANENNINGDRSHYGLMVQGVLNIAIKAEKYIQKGHHSGIGHLIHVMIGGEMNTDIHTADQTGQTDQT